MSITQSDHIISDAGKDSATNTWNGVSVKQIVLAVQSLCTLPESLIKAVLAVCISVKLNLPSSLWLMVIGVPSSAKTDLVNLLRSFKLVYFVDTLTQNPFASGYIAPQGKKTYDMLPQLNYRCFVVKDYTTLFSLNNETIKKLLGELVSIYDGQFKKFSPTRGLKEYNTIFSHLGCITPSALNRHTQYMNIIGPRFMFYRIPQLNAEKSKKGFEIAWQPNRKKRLKKVQKMVCSFLDQAIKKLEANENIEIDFNDEQIKTTLEYLAIFTSKSRGIVITQRQSFKDEEGKSVTYHEVIDWQVEEPWRAFQQLKGLAIALAVINQTNKITHKEINILKKIVLSSMPVQRAEALECFKKERVLTSKKLSQLIKKSQRTCQRLLKELQFLGIVETSESSGSLAKEYWIKKQFANLFQPTPSNSVSRLKKELKDNPLEKMRGLLIQDLNLVHDKELALYLKTAEKWLLDNMDKIKTDEYDFIHSIWEKIDKETNKRKKEVEKQNEFTNSDQRFINKALSYE
jgi:hypothetical protein